MCRPAARMGIGLRGIYLNVFKFISLDSDKMLRLTIGLNIL
jgi:hypothetical protein